jgi:hypothetical protein
MTHSGESGPWWTLTCRSTLRSGRWAGLRCWRGRWHFGPHQGGDLMGPTWEASSDSFETPAKGS